MLERSEESLAGSVSTCTTPASKGLGRQGTRSRNIEAERRPCTPGARRGAKGGLDAAASGGAGDSCDDLAALRHARVCVQAALQELSGSVRRAQANLSSAAASFGKGSTAECEVDVSWLESGELPGTPPYQGKLDADGGAMLPSEKHRAKAGCKADGSVCDACGRSGQFRSEAEGGAGHDRRRADRFVSEQYVAPVADTPTSQAMSARAISKGFFPSIGSETSVWEEQAEEGGRLVTVASTYTSEVAVNAETLPDTWPTSLKIRWQADMENVLLKSRNSLPRRTSSPFRIDTGSLEYGCAPPRKSWYVIHPSSRGRMAYDFASAFMLAFDLVVIPWMVAWDVSPAGGLYVMQWTMAIFWSMDIGVMMITGFHVSDEYIFDLTAIVMRYLKSWFIPDVAIVVCDWVSLAAASTPGLRTLRLAKIGRLLRLLALIRLLKVTRVVSDHIEERLSDSAQMLFKFSKTICLTLMYAHIICCAWFLIGRQAPSDTGMRWIDSREIAEENVWYQYTSSFHWAMSQLTLGAVEIPSSSIAERLYSILCLLIGLLFGSTLVSTLSATMLEAQMQQREPHLMLQQMRRYMRENSVDNKLATRVERQLAERLAARHKIKEEEVKGMARLSTSLRSELRFHLMSPYLRSHSLFCMWSGADTRFMAQFCRKCMDFVHLRSQDDLFCAGKAAEFMYFFIQGKMTYTQEPESSPMVNTTKREVREGTWMAEAALWSHWIHVGTAHAGRFCEAARVHVTNIMEIMERTTTIKQVSMDYCQKFHQRLRAAKPPVLPWPDDLQVPLTEWSEMVPAMEPESQVVIGLETIRQAAGRLWLKASTRLDKLTDEVKAGKSTLMTNSDGDIERVVSVVALKIVTGQGRILVQVGKQLQSGKVKPVCQLPGSKPDRGEPITDTMGRLLDAWVSPIADSVHVDKIEREIEWKQSAEYGVRTKYLRHIVLSQVTSLAGIQDAGADPAEHAAATQVEGTMSVSSWRFRDHAVDARRAQAIAQVLRQRRAFCTLDEKGACAYVAWLSEQEFTLLSGPMADCLASEWEAWLERCARLAEGTAASAPISQRADEARTVDRGCPPRAAHAHPLVLGRPSAICTDDPGDGADGPGTPRSDGALHV